MVLFALWRAEDPASAPEAQRANNTGTGSVWVVEDGQMAWRPLGTAEKVAVSVLTLGQAMNAPSVQGRLMPGADVFSFRGLSRDYGVDANAVWYQGQVLPGAEPASFEVTEFGFAQDAVAIWQGDARVMQKPDGSAGDLVAFSGSVFSLGGQGYYRDAALPEPPTSPVAPFCRDWYAMNGALWLGARRLDALPSDPVVLDCDGSVLRRNGVEDISENRGLVLGLEQRLVRARLDGSVTELHRFDDKIAVAKEIESSILSGGLAVVQLVSGEAYVVGLGGGDENVQALGAQDAVDVEKLKERPGEVWFGQQLYVLLDRSERAAGAFVRELGQTQTMGEYLRAEDGIYHRGRKVAQPGDLEVRELQSASLLQIGPMCLSFGRYVTDLPETYDPQTLFKLCDVHRPPEEFLYDGMTLGFDPSAARPIAGQDGLYDWTLGEVFIVNVTEAPRDLSTDFVEGVAFFVAGFGKPIEAEVTRPDPGPGGVHRLEPGARLSWPVTVRVQAPDLTLSYFVTLTHLPDRAAVLGETEHRFTSGVVPEQP